MGHSVVVNGPVLDVIKIIEPEAHALLLVFKHVGVQCTAEERHIRTQVKARPIKEDELSQPWILRTCPADAAREVRDLLSHAGPVGIEWFMISEEQENDLEVAELGCDEREETLVLDYTDVT